MTLTSFGPIFLSDATAVAPPDLGGTILGVLISSAFISAVIPAVINFFNNRRNATVASKKNEVDANSSIIGRYKEAAQEERIAKESAVAMVERMLSIAESQVDSLQITVERLQETVDRLTTTITVISSTANTQQSLIEDLTRDRDRVVLALQNSERQLAEQIAYITLAQEQKLQTGPTTIA
jgi:hypothetical protein